MDKAKIKSQRLSRVLLFLSRKIPYAVFYLDHTLLLVLINTKRLIVFKKSEISKRIKIDKEGTKINVMREMMKISSPLQNCLE